MPSKRSLCFPSQVRTTSFPALTGEELAQTGRALFGGNWRAEMARALDLADDALIRAVEAGRATAPAEWRARLIAVAQDVALRAMATAGALLGLDEAEHDESAAAQENHPRLV